MRQERADPIHRIDDIGAGLAQDYHQDGVLRISSVQARMHRATSVNAPPARMMENHPARLRRG